MFRPLEGEKGRCQLVCMISGQWEYVEIIYTHHPRPFSYKERVELNRSAELLFYSMLIFISMDNYSEEKNRDIFN